MFSTTEGSHFCSVVCVSHFCSTVLSPVSNCRQTGTKPEYIERAMERSSSSRLGFFPSGDLSGCGAAREGTPAGCGYATQRLSRSPEPGRPRSRSEERRCPHDQSSADPCDPRPRGGDGHPHDDPAPGLLGRTAETETLSPGAR